MRDVRLHTRDGAGNSGPSACGGHDISTARGLLQAETDMNEIELLRLYEDQLTAQAADNRLPAHDRAAAAAVLAISNRLPGTRLRPTDEPWTWVFCDPHFEHEGSVAVFCRPFRHRHHGDSYLLEHWTRDVRDHDTVICLGDITWTVRRTAWSTASGADPAARSPDERRKSPDRTRGAGPGLAGPHPNALGRLEGGSRLAPGRGCRADGRRRRRVGRDGPGVLRARPRRARGRRHRGRPSRRSGNGRERRRNGGGAVSGGALRNSGTSTPNTSCGPPADLRPPRRPALRT